MNALARAFGQPMSLDLTRAPSNVEVKTMRQEAGHSQRQAGEVVHVARRTWQDWEAGIAQMTPGLRELYLLKTGQIDLPVSHTDKPTDLTESP